MQKIDKKINNFIKELDYEVINQMFEKISSGKKLRSKLIYKISTDNDKSVQLCAIVELIHLASLLHDDVIDSAKLRRKNPSINAVYGDKNAIMLGDVLYSKAFNELCKMDSKISNLISNAVCKLSIGELMDVELSKNFNSNENLYFKMIYYKTAVLIEAASGCAAILANLDEKSYREYGKNLGIAFQIIDDILDISQDEKILGKPAMADFKDGKSTLPYILLFKNQNTDEQQITQNLFKKNLDNEEILWLKEQFEKYNIIQKSFFIAKDYANKALLSTNNQELKQIIDDMINRKF